MEGVVLVMGRGVLVLVVVMNGDVSDEDVDDGGVGVDGVGAENDDGDDKADNDDEVDSKGNDDVGEDSACVISSNDVDNGGDGDDDASEDVGMIMMLAMLVAAIL